MDLPFDLSKISPDELASLGADKVAYMKKMLSDDASKLIEEAEDIPDGIPVWVLFAADGRPLALADDAESVFSSAFHHDLTTVALH